jgi:hypothetical protein
MFAITSDFQEPVGNIIKAPLYFVGVVKKDNQLSTACFWYGRSSNICGKVNKKTTLVGQGRSLYCIQRLL